MLNNFFGKSVFSKEIAKTVLGEPILRSSSVITFIPPCILALVYFIAPVNVPAEFRRKLAKKVKYKTYDCDSQ